MAAEHVSFLRVNKATILAAFQNLDLQQVEDIVEEIKLEYPSLVDEDQYSSAYPLYHNFTIVNFHASSVSDGAISGAEGYYVLQIDKMGTPIPWGVTEYIKELVNRIAFTGSLNTSSSTPSSGD